MKKSPRYRSLNKKARNLKTHKFQNMHKMMMRMLLAELMDQNTLFSFFKEPSMIKWTKIYLKEDRVLR